MKIAKIKKNLSIFTESGTFTSSQMLIEKLSKIPSWIPKVWATPPSPLFSWEIFDVHQPSTALNKIN